MNRIAGPRARPSLTMSLCGLGVAGALGVAAPAGGGSQPLARHPDPQTYHWVLPAQHAGVEVVALHPGDCYVLRRVAGVVYFGPPLPGVLELQRQFGDPVSHLVDGGDDHPECRLAGCTQVARLTDAIMTRVLESGDRRARRVANHRPSPLDGMQGGVYTDVGSAEPTRYRQAPEQRMAYLHLRTAHRSNCYETTVPRALTVHIRDGQRRPDRTGVYSGYLYLEHHHDPPRGRVAWRDPAGAGPMAAFGLFVQSGARSPTRVGPVDAR